MIKIAICDDDEVYNKKLGAFIKAYFENEDGEYEIKSFIDGNELIDFGEYFDLIFLDIEMPQITGIEIAKKINKIHKSSIIFFVTNYEEYLDEAFDVNAFRYFNKPIDERRLKRSLGLAVNKIKERNGVIELNIMGKQVYQNMDKIIYIAIENRHCRVVTTEGDKIVDNKIKDIGRRLPENRFAFPIKAILSI